MSNATPPQMDKAERQQWLHFWQSMDADINPQAVRLMEELRSVSHALYLIAQQSIAETGLSWAKYRLLMGLLFAEQEEGREMLNPSEISQRQGTSRNTISALIRDLETDGLIERHLDKVDRRKFNIALTKAGRTHVLANASNHLHRIHRCFNELTPMEQTTLSQLLQKLDVSLSQQR